jgi:hypothetical protein
LFCAGRKNKEKNENSDPLVFDFHHHSPVFLKDANAGVDLGQINLLI